MENFDESSTLEIHIDEMLEELYQEMRDGYTSGEGLYLEESSILEIAQEDESVDGLNAVHLTPEAEIVRRRDSLTDDHIYIVQLWNNGKPLDSFPTIRLAREYCKWHSLEVKREVEF